MQWQGDPRPIGLSLTVMLCVTGIVLLFLSDFAAALPRTIHTPGKGKATSLKEHAEQLRQEALQRINKATLQDLNAAAVRLQKSAKLFRVLHSGSLAARDYLSLGEIYFTWSRYQEALQTYRFALALSEQADRDLKCSILSHIAVTYATTGSIGKALDYAKQALKLAKASTNPDAAAEASNALGLSLLYSEDPRQAVGLFQSAAEIFKESGSSEAQAATAHYTGWALAELGRTNDALAEQNKGLRLWMSTGNLYGIAQAHAALGLLWDVLGEPDKALSLYKQAEERFSSIGDRDNEAIVLNGLGRISAELGNYENSLHYFHQARLIFTSVADQFGEIGAIDGAAKAEWSLGERRQAEMLYKAKLTRARRAHDYRAQIDALANLADVFAVQHKYTQARASYLQALSLCRSETYVWGETSILVSLGHLYTDTGNYTEAARVLHRALKLSESTSEIGKRSRVHHELALTFQELKQYDEARVQSENAIQIIESERTKVSDFDSRATYFASVHQYYQLYIDILMELDQQHPGQGFAQLAFEAAEKSKVRSLLDMLASTSEGTQCNPAALETNVNSEESKPQPGDCSTPAASALTLAQVQKEIHGDDVALLEYALSPQASYLWLVENGQITSYRLRGERQIAELAVRYRAALTARQPLSGENAAQQAARVAHADQELDHLSADLSKILLGPVAGSLTGKHVVVVPDGVLRYIPFAALQLPASVGPKTDTLGKKFDVVTLPSASTLASLRAASANRPTPTRLAAVFADPVFAADDPRVQKQGRSKAPPVQIPTLSAALRDVPVNSSRIPRLVASGAEATAIADALFDKVDVVTGFAANRGAVLSGDLGQYRYIHFATHGLLDSRHPELSGLVLSLVDQDGKPEDGYLRVRDIYNLKLSADLVVLSSCNSALGKDVESEGIIGLTRAFLFAGSKRVISSLWKVDDKATEELMKNFYSQLHAGASPAAALRSAQSALASDPHWKSPYYWAGFILQGEYK